MVVLLKIFKDKTLKPRTKKINKTSKKIMEELNSGNSGHTAI